MSSLARRWIAIGALLGAVGVGLGAYGAHGLSDLLQRSGFAGDDLARRLARFDTAIRYQMLHAIALVITGFALEQRASGWWRFAAWAFFIGVLVFSGLLKVMTFADPKWNWLGAIVPIGGVSLILGWLSLAVGALPQELIAIARAAKIPRRMQRVTTCVTILKSVASHAEGTRRLIGSAGTH